MKRIRFLELVEPIKSIFKERATQFAFLTLVSVSLYSIVDKVAVSHVHPIIFTYFYTFFGLAFITPYILSVKDRSLIQNEWKASKGKIIVNGFLGIFGYSLILMAFAIEKVSYPCDIGLN